MGETKHAWLLLFFFSPPVSVRLGIRWARVLISLCLLRWQEHGRMYFMTVSSTLPEGWTGESWGIFLVKKL